MFWLLYWWKYTFFAYTQPHLSLMSLLPKAGLLVSWISNWKPREAGGLHWQFHTKAVLHLLLCQSFMLWNWVEGIYFGGGMEKMRAVCLLRQNQLGSTKKKFKVDNWVTGFPHNCPINRPCLPRYQIPLIIFNREKTKGEKDVWGHGYTLLW